MVARDLTKKEWNQYFEFFLINFVTSLYYHIFFASIALFYQIKRDFIWEWNMKILNYCFYFPNYTNPNNYMIIQFIFYFQFYLSREKNIWHIVCILRGQWPGQSREIKIYEKCNYISFLYIPKNFQGLKTSALGNFWFLKFSTL